MEEFMTNNASAIFALAGTFVGAFTTGIINYFLKTKETKLRLTEKLLDKKLTAHESLINTVNLIRSMVLLGGEDDNGELKRCPLIMNSKKNMDDFLEQFMIMQSTSDKWFSSSIKREISLFLDYFINLNEHCRDSLDPGIQEVGVIIRNDFIDIAVRLEDCAHNFFNKDMLKLKYKTDRKWHKYPVKKTMAFLNGTEFYKHKQEIIEILGNRT